MALIFPRVANNFARNGYYPTDASTLERILSFIQSKPEKAELDHPFHTQILDPCAGEGVALAEFKHHLGNDYTTAYGIEFNEERAYHAKSLLDVAIHGDMQDCIFKRNQFGLLFLNPPYGDLASDQADLSERQFIGRQRLEKLFYQQTYQSLMFDGLMVLIIPDYALDDEFAGWIARHFGDLKIYRAVDESFKQVVIFGQRQRTNRCCADTLKSSKALLLNQDDLETIPLLDDPHYAVPQITTDQPLIYTRMDEAQLSIELESLGNCPGLWAEFESTFSTRCLSERRPLMELSDWHLALALAAGKVTGRIDSNDDQSSLLIKGNTHKEKAVTQSREENSDGDVTEIRTHTDRFISVIKGIDITKGPTYGDIVTFR